MAGRKLQINGDGTMTLPSGCVDAESCTSTPGKEVPLNSQRHLFRKECLFDLDAAGVPVTKTFLLYRAKAAGNVRNFGAMLHVAGSASSMTFDLKKNGVSILSGVVTVTNATGNDTFVTAGGLPVNYVAGDVFIVVLTVTTATGAQGPYCDAEFDEVAS